MTTHSTQAPCCETCQQQQKKKKKKTERKQANWPTNQTAPQLSTLLWISTITGLHVLIHLPLGLLHYSHTLCFLTLQSSVHLGLFLPVLPDFRPCYSVLCILHLFLPIMCSLSWIMVLLFFMDEQLISCCLAIRTPYTQHWSPAWRWMEVRHMKSPVRPLQGAPM